MEQMIDELIAKYKEKLGYAQTELEMASTFQIGRVRGEIESIQEFIKDLESLKKG